MFNSKNKLNKKIYFVIPNKHWGTYFLRGVQVTKQLRKNGVDAVTLSTKKAAKVKNGIVVFVKNIKKELCETVKNNNNTVIYDILDGYDQDIKFISDEDVIDGIILATESSKKKVLLPDTLVNKTIYHHIDPRLEKIVNNADQEKSFKMCYIGNLPEHTANVSFVDRISDISIIETNTRKAGKNDWMRSVSQYNCHYAVRTDETQRKAKPLIKVSVAAVCNANIIVNRSNAASELLGDGYPFYTNDDYESVQSVLRYVREIFGSDVWKKGLEQMAYLKKRLSISNIIHEYIDFLQQWE